MTREL
jgi:hypothetical protein